MQAAENRRQWVIAMIAVAAMGIAGLLRLLVYWQFLPVEVGRFNTVSLPLLMALLLGGLPLVWDLLVKLCKRQFGADLLAGIAILTAILLQEYLAGTLVVLMLSGGEALEAYAVRSASGVLQALAKRMPTTAHRVQADELQSITLDKIAVGDRLVVFPHEVCPVDGQVIEGRGVMDESYLTGEPYLMAKTPGSAVLSGAINGETALTIQAEKLAVDSRYAQIMSVIEASQQQKPRIRRLGDRLGALYTPIAVAIAVLAWWASGDPIRFLAVLVVATPCPLLIAIPVTIIGSISLAAKRAIVIRDPTVLEKLDTVRTVIFDKTGTLTYGRPQWVASVTAEGFTERELLRQVASVERFSKHPLALALVEAAERAKLELRAPAAVTEAPGKGLVASLNEQELRITSRNQLLKEQPELRQVLAPTAEGLECVVLVDGRYAGLFQFRDAPRAESALFVQHLQPRHGIERIMLVSGDRESEVRYLAAAVGVTEIYAGQSPEQKLQIVQRETDRRATLFVGDGINDAPALLAATVGVAFGQNSDVTTEAAGAVILDSSLRKVDELMHISRRMRRIALQSAVGGMGLSVLAMFVAAAGYLPPVAGAITQEIIDVLAVLNALRVAIPPRSLTDF